MTVSKLRFGRSLSPPAATSQIVGSEVLLSGLSRVVSTFRVRKTTSNTLVWNICSHPRQPRHVCPLERLPAQDEGGRGQ
jgi:hypothetical protein